MYFIIWFCQLFDHNFQSSHGKKVCILGLWSGHFYASRSQFNHPGRWILRPRKPCHARSKFSKDPPFITKTKECCCCNTFIAKKITSTCCCLILYPLYHKNKGMLLPYYPHFIAKTRTCCCLITPFYIKLWMAVYTLQASRPNNLKYYPSYQGYRKPIFCRSRPIFSL